MLADKSTLVPLDVRGFDRVLRRFSERIPAGFPSAAEGYEDEPLNLHTFVVRHPAATFFYRFDDDNLLDEHIVRGSVLVIDKSLRATPGRLVMVEQGGAFVIMRMPRDSATRLHVFGVVAAVVTRL